MTDHSLSVAEIQRQISRLGGEPGDFSLDLRAQCDSTNSRLLELAERGAPSGTVVVSEDQTAGRGRRGRQWLSAPGDSVTFSLLWRFPPTVLPTGLSLAAGVAIIRALGKVSRQGTGRPSGRTLCGASPALRPPQRCHEDGTATKLRLKWPNDVLLDGGKLAGTLVELVSGAPHAAVIGIGLNRQLPAELPDELRPVCAAWPEDTTADELIAALRAEWLASHAYQDQPIVMLGDFAAAQAGICRGVDGDGALLLEHDGRIERILSGEVSLRPGSLP